ncbi:hypothetical protein [Halostagnicola bangensis]
MITTKLSISTRLTGALLSIDLRSERAVVHDRSLRVSFAFVAASSRFESNGLDGGPRAGFDRPSSNDSSSSPTRLVALYATNSGTSSSARRQDSNYALEKSIVGLTTGPSELAYGVRTTTGQ